jgi:hypothetical protein
VTRAADEISNPTFVARVQGWFGHAQQAKDVRLIERMVERVLNGV